MSITFIRVINQQTTRRSILLDKLDDGQANVSGYAFRNKQKVYIPYFNTVDPSVKGYVDLIPTDRVLLSADRGTIKGLKSSGRIDAFAFSSALTAVPTVTAAAHSGVTFDTTVDGTTYLSVTPDVTYITFTNLANATQKVPSSAFAVFTATQIKVADAVLTIGTPAVGWKVTVQSNSRSSATFTL